MPEPARETAADTAPGTAPEVAAERERAREALLAAAGWAAARRLPLAGDASPRRYLRLCGAAGTAVLMDADPATGEDVGPFLRIARHLSGLGLSPPVVLAADRRQGFLLLEDLGDDLYARVTAHQPAAEPALYAAAVDVLLHLQAQPAPAGLAEYDAAAMGEAAALAVTWYARAATGAAAGAAADPAPLAAAVAEAVAEAVAALAAAAVTALRDYHAENLIWLPRREGLRRVGLLDFQSAERAPPEYDLVSLLQDARRDVAPAVAAAAVRQFAAGRGASLAETERAIATLGAQRALRILGVFARLCLRDGKPGYLRLLPRVWAQLAANLAAPPLAPLARLVARHVPPPAAAVLAGIEAGCGRSCAR
jgi:aminoglycoside/choline kinase family phosphotransferase